jgi:hypothetical protein
MVIGIKQTGRGKNENLICSYCNARYGYASDG